MAGTDDSGQMMTAVPMLPLRERDPRQLGSFRLLGRLGAGGMGVAFLAERAGQWAVVKMIRPDLADDPSFRSRLSRELDAMRRAAGPQTAALLDADVSADPPWFAMEFIPGTTLARRVADAGPLAPTQLVAFAADLATALARVHEAGVVHRDLKPANIMLSPAGPRLIDFGIANLGEGTQLTRTGMVLGSSGWLSPEQVTGGATTPATDVHAWGLCVLFAATVEAPFGRDNTTAVIYKVLEFTPDIPVDIQAPLRNVLLSALAKDPSQRASPDRVIRDIRPDGAKVEQSAIVPRRSPVPEQVPLSPGIGLDPDPEVGAEVDEAEGQTVLHRPAVPVEQRDPIDVATATVAVRSGASPASRRVTHPTTTSRSALAIPALMTVSVSLYLAYLLPIQLIENTQFDGLVGRDGLGYSEMLALVAGVVSVGFAWTSRGRPLGVAAFLPVLTLVLWQVSDYWVGSPTSADMGSVQGSQPAGAFSVLCGAVAVALAFLGPRLLSLRFERARWPWMAVTTIVGVACILGWLLPWAEQQWLESGSSVAYTLAWLVLLLVLVAACALLWPRVAAGLTASSFGLVALGVSLSRAAALNARPGDGESLAWYSRPLPGLAIATVAAVVMVIVGALMTTQAVRDARAARLSRDSGRPAGRPALLWAAVGAMVAVPTAGVLLVAMTGSDLTQDATAEPAIPAAAPLAAGATPTANAAGATTGAQPRVSVPDVVGVALEEATQTLTSYGMTFVVYEEQRVDTPAGEVLRQVPLSGTSVTAQRVTLYVARRPNTVGLFAALKKREGRGLTWSRQVYTTDGRRMAAQVKPGALRAYTTDKETGEWSLDGTYTMNASSGEGSESFTSASTRVIDAAGTKGKEILVQVRKKSDGEFASGLVNGNAEKVSILHSGDRYGWSTFRWSSGSRRLYVSYSDGSFYSWMRFNKDGELVYG